MTRDWLLARLAPPPAAFRGDHDLNPGWAPGDGAPEESLTRAAVLAPLVERPDGLTVLLTRRTDHLAHHPGQISFPGGRQEPDDATPEHAALRETEEEIGLHRRHIEILGRLDPYVTRTGFHITPVVALVRPPFELVPDPHEVAEVFEVPLAFLLDPANHQRHSRTHKGNERQFYAMPYGNYYIWGATAGMLINLYDRLSADSSTVAAASAGGSP